jgi:CheY-like chemotaxis protein
MTFFLIDDDQDDQEFFRLAIDSINPSINCEIADDCVAALERLKSSDQTVPDLIFVDMRMPKMNGPECVKVLKSEKRLNGVPIILYSTSDSENILASRPETAPDHFFTKPTSIPDLASVIRDAMAKFRKTI